METKNVMIVGVGGQGSLLASKLLGRLLLSKGYDIKVSEVHGMSQRGGSVVTYVRFGEKVYSPVIDKGEADFIVSFELLEAARWTAYLKPGGKIITNTQQINPMPVIIGAAQYPENLLEKMAAAGLDVDALDALSLAEQAGSSKAVNIVLMGHLSRYFDFTEEEWLNALADSFASIAAEKGVALSVEGCDGTVEGYPVLLRELFHNLIDNAIKYTPAGGSVAVQLSQQEGHFRCRVADTGIGIPQEHQAHVFERFYRVDKSHSRQTGGTGLGLAIVKHVAEVHQAQVQLESKPQEGTAVSVLFR